MSVMSTTFTALALNLTILRERGILKRMRGTPMPSSAYLAGWPANAVTNTALQVAIVIVAGKLVLRHRPGRATGSRCSSSSCSAPSASPSLGVALSHAIPNFESAPAYVNAVFLPMIMHLRRLLRRRRRARRSCATSPRRCRSST